MSGLPEDGDGYRPEREARPQRNRQGEANGIRTRIPLAPRSNSQPPLSIQHLHEMHQ